MFSHRFWRVVGAAAIAMALIATAGPQAVAQTTYTWEGNVDAFWSTPGNWLPAPGGVPGSTDTVIFDDTAMMIAGAATEVDRGGGAHWG